MIRFIDLRHVADDIEGDRFAFYDTVTARFIEDGTGVHTWETINAFARGYSGEHELARFVELTPEWAKHAAPEREVFKIEIQDHGTMRAYGEATNKSGSAACQVPLSPVVLQAMQGRQVAYFYGAETYGHDEEVGAITGMIVIDFEAEAEGATW